MENTYFILDENNIIINAVIADEEYATQMNYKPYVEGLWIGDEYKTPEPEKQTPIPDEQTIEYMNNSIQDGIDLV